jgi:MFS family permease
VLTNRWSVLALLFLVRTSLGFQFQSVPALAPTLMSELALGVADIGLLIGLYNAPGILLAIPGGAIGQWVGDKRTVLAGLLLMMGGQLVMAFVPELWAQIAGRLVTGIGGTLLNVLMAKMVADWFAGREISTAMGLFMNSFPFGIALALVTLPAIAEAGGLVAASLTVAGLNIAAFLALALLYRPPATAPGTPGGGSMWPGAHATLAVLLAGLIWGLYNGGFSTVVGFGPLMLTERGLSSIAASSLTSIVIWSVVAAQPIGGVLADRSGRPYLFLVVSLLAFAAALVLAVRTEQLLIAFVALGVLSGIPVGTIMSMPSRILAPEARAVGMGLFYTATYTLHFVSPWVIGHVAEADGNVQVTFDCGAIAVVLSCLALAAFGWITRKGRQTLP